ncbi:iron ABC transporter permease [Flavimobilis sp. GY10621]|uniref:Iron ABC transporter permease n=1 Tax=Flavimobilis rhizosphaerae TaxID=2775421 RepID=A0ABR9DLL1_9MICO|nr:iron ABC transporter permease [Flavimobilis rhizosphaerae]
MTAPAPVLPARRRRGVVLLCGLVVALLAAATLSAVSGQTPVTAAEVLGAVLHRLGIDAGPLPAHPQGEATLWVARFPRIVLGLLVGAALGCAGALMQGVFGNPLAEPGVIGISSGAAVGACLVIVLPGSVLGATGSLAVAGAAFVGGLVTTAVVYALARANGRTEVVTLVLTGVAVNAFAAGVLAFLVYVADPSAREQIVFWQLGSLNGATWRSVGIVAPMVVAGLVGSWLLARRLDLLSLGERAARHVGLDVERLRQVAIVLVALLTSAGVAFTGIIAFVGLVVPHVVRMVAGPGHRVLLPASALGGALVLVVADLVARTAVAHAELPLGMLTSLVGGPFFFWLLRRTRASQGGWA